MTILEALRITTENIKTWVESKFFKKGEATADDFGIYVLPTEPMDARPGDIWIDLSNDPTIIPQNYPNQLPNPYSLTISGAASGVYDGTSAVEVVIPTIPSKLSEFTNDKGYITSYIETDPTVPTWAKASTKPTYTKSEIGLGNVDNVKQYSASNPPPYPVTSVNGKTGTVTVSELPTVTTADNGKVLMVVNGSWQVVDMTLSISSDGVISI